MQSPRHWNDRQMVHTHTLKPLHEQEDVTVLWKQAENTDREVAANRPREKERGEKKKKTCLLIAVLILTDKNVVQKEAEKKLQYKSLCIEIQWMWNMNCYTSNIWNHWYSKKRFKETLKKRSIDALQDSYTRNIMHNRESTAVWNWKPEWWGEVPWSEGP